MTRRRAGYSLFEVLLSFAIMSMVLAVILPRQSGLLGRVALIDERHLAHDYALSRLDRLGLSDPLTPGIITQYYRGWRVTQSISDMAQPDLQGRRQLRVFVTVQTASGAELATVASTRALP